MSRESAPRKIALLILFSSLKKTCLKYGNNNNDCYERQRFFYVSSLKIFQPFFIYLLSNQLFSVANDIP